MEFRKVLITGLLLLSASAQAQNCYWASQEGFAMEPRSETVQTYECTDRLYPYFGRLNYTVQQGINCNNESWPSKAVMNCENRSRQEREVRNVSLLCCDSAN